MCCVDKVALACMGYGWRWCSQPGHVPCPPRTASVSGRYRARTKPYEAGELMLFILFSELELELVTRVV